MVVRPVCLSQANNGVDRPSRRHTMGGMNAATVWFNQGSGDLVEVLHLLRSARRPGEIRLLGTHPRSDFPAAALGDAFEREPARLDDAAYLAAHARLRA